tara:strand:+ start:1026 stop:1793 length:768 start_codon:yes stop_codon:yes gene_type:complete
MLSLRQALSLDTIRNLASYKNLYSLSFDGVDEELSIPSAGISPNTSGGNRGWSISFWLKNDSGTKTQQIMSIDTGSGREFKCVMRFNGNVKFTLIGNNNAGITQDLNINTDLADSQWHHFVFIYDLGSANTSLIAYVDNVLHSQAQGNATYTSAGTWAAISNTGQPLRVAYQGGSYGQIKFDELSVFDNVLTAGNVSDIYNGGETADVSSIAYLTGWWRMGDGATFPTIPDASSNSNNGTMTNMESGDIITDVPS